MPHMITASLVACGLLCAWVPTVRAQDDPWQGLRFLMGNWEAIAEPGQGRGYFSLAPDLQGKVLVRKNHAELPAQGQRPAGKHDDLMVIYGEGKTLKAIYFDSEKHVIHYTVTADGKTATFLSEPGVGPRFRLTYSKGKANTVAIRFDIAPPGKPEVFRTYLQGKVRPRQMHKP